MPRVVDGNFAGALHQVCDRSFLAPPPISDVGQNNTHTQGNTEGVISRQASGLSFDFPPGDGATYFAGTEDGLIHKCSVSYNEQYLETYHGHTGPVYRIRCSPFYDRLFLSCRCGKTGVYAFVCLFVCVGGGVAADLRHISLPNISPCGAALPASNGRQSIAHIVSGRAENDRKQRTPVQCHMESRGGIRPHTHSSTRRIQ